MSHWFVIACLSFALVAIALAFVREARLRRALQTLLARLLNHWRSSHDQTHRAAPDRRHAPDGARERV